MAAVYTVFVIAEILILPLFPAQPKLGPVFNPVTHMIPAKFPILILVPALALDLLWQRVKNWKPWQIALVSGVAFHRRAYGSRMAVCQLPALGRQQEPLLRHYLFRLQFARRLASIACGNGSHPDHGVALYSGLLRAAVYASISTWIGLLFGRWMRGVQR